MGYFSNPILDLMGGQICYMDLYNSAFTTRIQRLSFTLKTSQPGINSPINIFPQDFWELPDGKFAFLMGMSSHTHSDLRLIINSDSLDISTFGQNNPEFNSIFLKLESGGCLKQVKGSPYVYMGFGKGTAQGNFLSVVKSYPHDVFEVRNRNGDTLKTIRLGLASNSFANIAYWEGLNLSRVGYKITTSNDSSTAWVGAGNKLSKITLSDPVTIDESAAGCLRGSALTSVHNQDFDSRKIRINTYNQSLEILDFEGGNGKFQILGSDGRQLQSGTWQGPASRIQLLPLPAGVYQIVLQDKRMRHSTRFVR